MATFSLEYTNFILFYFCLGVEYTNFRHASILFFLFSFFQKKKKEYQVAVISTLFDSSKNNT